MEVQCLRTSILLFRSSNEFLLDNSSAAQLASLAHQTYCHMFDELSEGSIHRSLTTCTFMPLALLWAVFKALTPTRLRCSYLYLWSSTRPFMSRMVVQSDLLDVESKLKMQSVSIEFHDTLLKRRSSSNIQRDGTHFP